MRPLQDKGGGRITLAKVAYSFMGSLSPEKTISIGGEKMGRGGSAQGRWEPCRPGRGQWGRSISQG